MKKKYFWKMPLIAAVFCILALAACDNATTGSANVPINIAEITGVDVPVIGERPVTRITPNNQFTGTVSWRRGDETITNPAEYRFQAETYYTATITLTPTAGFTLRGVAANHFTVEGATSFSNAAGSGVVTATFPATGTTAPTTIYIYAITGVAIPVAGETPDTTIDATQFTGVVAWMSGTNVIDNPGQHEFQPGTIYTATITLTPRTNFTLNGVPANFFTVEGTSTPATNAANSGLVTATFPATGDPDNPEVIDMAAIDGIAVPVAGGTPVTTITANNQFTGTVRWERNGNAVSAWHTFRYGTVYTAIITLTARDGFTLDGVAANSFTVAGANQGQVSNAADSGVVSAVFPATGPAAVNITQIPGVAVPLPGGTSVSEITATGQFSGTVVWERDGIALGAGYVFGHDTRYTAVITLEAAIGFTFEGVPANFFTVAGAEANNYADYGVVRAEFPITAPVGRGVLYWVNDRGLLVADNENITLSVSDPANNTITFTAGAAGFTSHRWHINGVEVGAAGQASFTFSAARRIPGSVFIIGLRVQRGARFYSANFTVTVTE